MSTLDVGIGLTIGKQLCQYIPQPHAVQEVGPRPETVLFSATAEIVSAVAESRKHKHFFFTILHDFRRHFFCSIQHRKILV